MTKCPRCKGVVGTLGYREHSVNAAQGREEDCDHCGGTGEIPNETWWLCEVLLPPDGGSWIQVLYHKYGDWYEADFGGEIKTTSVRPMARMKAVK